MIYRLENKWLRAMFHQRGAAVTRLVFKPLERDVMRRNHDPTASHHYINNVVGPIANRIEGGRFAIDGEIFALDQNEGTTTLHGGRCGLSELDWTLTHQTETDIHFETNLPHLHMGFPGPSHFTALYRLEGPALRVEYQATSPRKNAFNLAPHFYFNLTGKGDISDHQLQIQAEHYLPVDTQNIPAGTPASVANTIFDFRTIRPIADLALDHNFCLTQGGMRPALRMSVPDLHLQVTTDQPGLQLYDARHMDRKFLAIEPQSWPNAVNQPNFPSQIKKANSRYCARSQFEFHQPMT